MKRSNTNLLERVLKDVSPVHCDFHMTWKRIGLEKNKQTNKRNSSFPPSNKLQLSSCVGFDVISLYVNDCPKARKSYS